MPRFESKKARQDLARPGLARLFQKNIPRILNKPNYLKHQTHEKETKTKKKENYTKSTIKNYEQDHIKTVKRKTRTNKDPRAKTT
ncbi:34177_t:CDS:2 [Gigaspora margarita]|uniref:34177_t:CDS:1 n=1 Tax=Gigaspora margarita TaxID=4874 RepID=A0ABN7UW12_GIGMA|nr:34177_t:CDS:2 [Gigaspora margarita]